jgi:predicted nucleic acid-binding protein
MTFMPAPEFLDTNVLVYAYDLSNARKREIAQDLVRQALTGDMAISTQVLAEFSATLLHKISPAVKPEELAAALDALDPIRLIAMDGDVVRRAVEARARYGVHFYDGMILATAERGGCTRIWSEDLNAGQEYFGIPVQNPFS